MEILSIIQKTIKIRRYNESKSFFEFLNNNIIPYVVVKGEPLSFLAYNESGKRKSADIDILIPKLRAESPRNVSCLTVTMYYGAEYFRKTGLKISS